MSISTSLDVNTSPTNTDTNSQPVSIVNSNSDKRFDDEKECVLGATIKKEQGVDSDGDREQQVKRRKEDNGVHLLVDPLLNANSNTCQSATTNVNSLGGNSKLKLVPSIVQLNSLDQVPPGGLKHPFIVTGHIVEHRPAQSRETKCTTNISSLQRVVNSAANNNSSNMSVVKNNSNNNLWKPSGNHATKLESMSKSNSPSSSSSSAPLASHKMMTPISRPDLVASSLSALHAGNNQNQSRTRPLLNNQNHQLFPSSNQQNYIASKQNLGLVSANQTSDNLVVGKLDTSTAIATGTLSSQLILSSIITANPGFNTHQLTNGGTLSGLKFCLSAAPQNTDGTSTNFASPLPGESSNKSVLETEEPSSSSASLTSAPSSNKTSSSSSPVGSLKPKSHSKTNRTNDEAQILEKSTSSSSGGSSNAQGNAAAARLLDLGKRLLEATKEGNTALVRELVVDSGAPFTSDWLDTTALHIAAQNGSLDIAEILIQGGINKDARTKLKRTALHLAAQSGSLDVTDLLIRSGSDVNSRDMLEMTPLHWAVERGHVCVVERLLMANADYTIKSKFRLTPIDIAKNARFFDIIELFKNWTSGTKDEDLTVYRNLETTLNESQDFLDIDYHLALVDSATNNQDGPTLDTDEPALDLVGLEWNKFDFAPELFLSNSSEDEHSVNNLMKIVEELQKENQQLRQKVEQLSTTDQ